MKIQLSAIDNPIDLIAVSFEQRKDLFKVWNYNNRIILPIIVIYFTKDGPYSSDFDDIILINKKEYKATELLIGTYLLFF